MNPDYTRSFLVCCLCMFLWSTGNLARAADSFPTKPVRVVVPFPPGGGVDTLARIIAPPLTEELGQQVVIDNRPGAGGVIGNGIAAQASPDGYTLLFQGIPFVVAPMLNKSAAYDPQKDFEAVALVASTPLVLVVYPGLEASSLKEFVEYAKGRQGKLNMASGGNGATAHLAAEVFKMSTGASFTHVPYKGMGPAVVDVIGGRVQSIFATLPSALPHIKAGRLKAIAVTSPKRSPFAPELKTAVESGYNDLVVVNWYGLLAPSGIPDAASRTIGAAVKKIVGAAAIEQRLAKAGLEANAAESDEFDKFLRSERERWARVVERSGMRIQ